MPRLSGGDIDVTAGTGFRSGEPIALVRLTVETGDGQSAQVWIRPLEARMVGLDLIGAAHSSIADCELRTLAKAQGLDGDGLIGALRKRTEADLGPG